MDCQIISVTDRVWTGILEKLRHDIYHLPEYLSVEANRLQAIPEAILISDGEKIFFLPYLIRNTKDVLPYNPDAQEVFDVISPYGYPGILLSESAINTPGFPDAALNVMIKEFQLRDICSAFFRLHPILNEEFIKIFKEGTFTLTGKTVSVDLRVDNLWTPTRKGHRSTINKCKRLGMVAKMVPFQDYMNELVSIYEETMSRVGATSEYYSFDLKYFMQMHDLLGSTLHLCIVEYEEQVACVGLYTESCGIVQSTLGGTRNQFVHLSPCSLETDYARYWAKERGNKFLHLGGGVGGSTEDKLYTFKSGFSNLSHAFLTLRLIIDDEKYCNLVNLRAKTLGCASSKLIQSEFFPAYRSY